ncbi:TPA: hypothetical protein ACY4SF_002598 [Clostridium perfringens]|uniref:hypothetical protein n=1 Tax=Clostridium perfringens TaxID=1502 RepID=UPI001898E8D3|nr:hypothetical protein [Clostridium perfringens]EGT0696015.1 hypothetical protein [Clostridium perfringens]MDH5084867.1 hypothetical protein [Clostridium perfringens]MDM0950206.1 hypothetical protein [Clostridium perfringens]MDM0970323.1 hypothetical protein [Clostridium perfringens]MEA5271125.1 hypothetical protein [Clostridium perfringens]
MRNFNLKRICIVFIIILILPNIIDLIKESNRKRELREEIKKEEEYEETEEYKEKKRIEEEDIKNRYKNQEPFIGMESKYVTHTVWGEPDKEYSHDYYGKRGRGIEYAYIWFSKDKKFLSDREYKVLNNTYYHYTVGSPLIEKEFVVTIGYKRKGYIDGAPNDIWFDEITEIY